MSLSQRRGRGAIRGWRSEHPHGSQAFHQQQQHGSGSCTMGMCKMFTGELFEVEQGTVWRGTVQSHPQDAEVALVEFQNLNVQDSQFQQLTGGSTSGSISGSIDGSLATAASPAKQLVCDNNSVCKWVAESIPLEVVREYNRRNGVDGPSEEKAAMFQQRAINPLSLAVDANASIYAKGVPRGHAFVDFEDYKKIYQTLGENKLMERGGTLTMDSSKRHLNLHQMDNGKSASVDVPLANYEFHTHPGTCQSRRSCALGCPSIQDMKNILERSNCNHTHFVFSWEGVYGVSVLRDQIRPQCGTTAASKHYKQLKMDSVYQKAQKQIRELDDLQTKFSTSPMEYDAFLEEWMKIIRRPGSAFRVMLFPMGKAPYVEEAA